VRGSLLVLVALGWPAVSLPQPAAFWAEAEGFTTQQGSVGPDRPPFASAHECLGSNFGGVAGHRVTFRFALLEAIPDAVLIIRYARLAEDEARFEVQLDGAQIGAARFPPTGGWGHTAAKEWAYAEVLLRPLAAGNHALSLVALGDRYNTNLDGFIIAGKGFAPPEGPEQLAQLPRLNVHGRGWGMPTDPTLTIESFAPRVPDPYYPPEEAAEKAAVKVPEVVELRDAAAVFRVGDDRREVRAGEAADGWRLLAVTSIPRAAVLEKRFRNWGLLAYAGLQGTVLGVRLPVGELASVDTPPVRYPPDFPEAVTRSTEDLLGHKILAQGEPSFETTFGLLPELVGYTPVSSPDGEQKLVIDEVGRIGLMTGGYGQERVQHLLFDPAEYVGELVPTAGRRGLLGGHLPAVHYALWDAEAEKGWEEIAFTPPGQPGPTFVALIRNGNWEFFQLEPDCTRTDAQTFFEALAGFCGYWQQELDPQLRADLPEPRLVDASLAALARSFTTFAGDRSKYGLGGYARDVHDGFPPTILWMVNACLEWGLFKKARAYLTYYFDHFLRDDGTFAYYGPAVSEYGQMLDCVVRYVRYTEDRDWLVVHRAKVEAIAGHLVRLRRESLAQPADAVTRGLLYGSPEADTHEQTEYYFSGTAWACRGLLELSRLDRQLGLPRGDEFEREAGGLRADLNRAARASLVPGDPPFLPPYPGITTSFPTMTAHQLASYTNYRYWLELLSAEVLDEDLEQAVFEYRRHKGGELSATTRFASHLDDWPLAQYGRALLADDRIDQYLLACYGHLALQQMPGTFMAYEQVPIRGTDRRPYVADYCVPAQLTMPLLVRWMLVYEERDSEALWLCKAVPRCWFAHGRSFRVRNAPTRWGPVSFEVRAEERRVRVEVLPPPRLEGEIVLRVRRPDGQRPERVSGGQARFDAQREAVVLPGREPVTVELAYEHQTKAANE